MVELRVQVIGVSKIDTTRPARTAHWPSALSINPASSAFIFFKAFRRQINHMSRLKCRVRNIPAILQG